MIEDHIRKTESAINTAQNISANKKAELLGQVARLKSALEEVPETHHEDVQSIARFAEAAAHEATRTKKNPKLLKTASRGLKQAVEEFEASHPKLVARVNEFATLLAEMGL